MKKRVDVKSLKKNTKSATRAIPLAVAISMLSAGSAFAAVDRIQVDLGDGKYTTFKSNLISSDSNYRAEVKSALEKAFYGSKSILVHNEDTDDWVNFGKHATEGLTLDEMLLDPDEYSLY